MGKSMEIQKLRAFAVLMVLFGHMPLKLPGFLLHGYTGVSLFFVISGYVVTLSFIRGLSETHTDGHNDIILIRDFFIRRIFRILPVAIMWVFIYFIIAQLINYKGGSYGDVTRWVKEFKWFFSGFYNYFYAASHMPGLFGHYWSLAVEMQFYCILPFLLLIFRKKKQQICLSVVCIILVSTLLRYITPSTSIGFLTHTQADALFTGVLICVLFNGKDNIDIKYKISQWAKNIIFLVLILILFLLPYWFDGKINPMLKYPIFTLIAGFIVYLAQRNTGWIIGGTKKIDKLLIYIGDRSYSLYVCHIILYSGVYYFLYDKYIDVIPDWIKNTSLGVTIQAVFLVVIALVISDLSYRFLEIPYLNHGKSIIKSLNSKKE